jgi:hypothetical protein
MEQRSSQSHPSMEACCARFGSQIVKNRKWRGTDPKRLETIARNALGVMREEGLFAFYLFLRYRWDDGGRVIWPQVKSLWQEVGPLLGTDGDDRQQVIALTENLHDLLLARQVAERALVYALYGLRAENKREKKE